MNFHKPETESEDGVVICNAIQDVDFVRSFFIFKSLPRVRQTASFKL
jgi:hypothetical protein